MDADQLTMAVTNLCNGKKKAADGTVGGRGWGSRDADRREEQAEKKTD